LVSLVVFLTSVSTYILFLPFFLLAFDANDQTNLIFVLLCNLLRTTILIAWISLLYETRFSLLSHSSVHFLLSTVHLSHMSGTSYNKH
jgi:hypothetical protein